jgi:hypothetical protein
VTPGEELRPSHRYARDARRVQTNDAPGRVSKTPQKQLFEPIARMGRPVTPLSQHSRPHGLRAAVLA